MSMKPLTFRLARSPISFGGAVPLPRVGQDDRDPAELLLLLAVRVRLRRPQNARQGNFNQINSQLIQKYTDEFVKSEKSDFE